MRPVPPPEELARLVGRALEAQVGIAVVDLLADGQPYQPSRGAGGSFFPASATAVRSLSPGAVADATGGLALRPPPDPGVRRVIVLPLDDGNWIEHDDALEARIAELIAAAR